MFSFLLNKKGNCLQLWTLLGGNLTLFPWTEALSRELISHTCLALLRSQGAPTSLLLVTAKNGQGRRWGGGGGRDKREEGDFPLHSRV